MLAATHSAVKVVVKTLYGGDNFLWESVMPQDFPRTVSMNASCPSLYRLSVCLSLYLNSIYLSIILFIYLSIYLCTYLYLYIND